MEQYYRTGYIWENYHDKTGEGKGTHPFTGWSALVVLMMAEKYKRENESVREMERERERER